VAEPSWAAGEALRGVAELDLDRAARRGYPEAVYCEGKTPKHVGVIAAAVGERAARTLFTRATPEHAKAVLAALPDAAHDETARLVAWPPEPPSPTGGEVLVLAAGTSDLPVAEEAAVCAAWFGHEVDRHYDVGVAGLHRMLRNLPAIRRASVLIVVAGMDGALPTVVANLVAVPVVAVPTSVGYGASFGGLAALLTMLNACAPGIGVVNIDNGYGAAVLASRIARGIRHPSQDAHFLR
jgi:NCAIR mutase (PurE)-related protein